MADQQRIGNDQRLSCVGRERRVPPAYADHLPHRPLDTYPIADAAGVVELNRDTAPKVRQGLLQRKRYAAADNRGSNGNAGKVEAHRVHAVDGIGEQRKREQHIAENARQRHPRE